MLKVLLGLASIVLPVMASAGEFLVQLGAREPLVFDLPPGWQARVARPRPDLPPTVTITSANPAAFQVLLTPIWPMNNALAPTRDDIRALVQRASSQAKSQAVEDALPITDLAALGKPGYYFSATDRAPEPGGYKFLTQGAVGISELRVTFTILINGEPGEVRKQALEMLRSMRRGKTKNAA